jgi:hypothetical protein
MKIFFFFFFFIVFPPQIRLKPVPTSYQSSNSLSVVALALERDEATWKQQ